MPIKSKSASRFPRAESEIRRRDVPSAPGRLRVYCLGPGVGESIVLHLPCGGWGVVDCYSTQRGGTLDFLRYLGVEKLQFFCLTHPHDDHFRGAYRLLDAYDGRIGAIWKYPALTGHAIKTMLSAAHFREQCLSDSEGPVIADEFALLLERLRALSERLDKENYRLVTGPCKLLDREHYRIDAFMPSGRDVERFHEILSREIVKACPMLLNEERGEFVNSLSVVLSINFGAADIWLLGDAQSPTTPLGEVRRRHTIVKLAHHGSCNGLSAEVLTMNRGRETAIDHAFVTPYNRSSLPTREWLSNYGRSCSHLIHTCVSSSAPVGIAVPGLYNPRLSDREFSWEGVEVSADGQVHPLPKVQCQGMP